MPSNRKSRGRPATNPQVREQQLIALATDLAARQLEDGSASSQVISHFLKLGSTREQLEQEKLRRDNLLLEAKMEQMASAGRVEVLYEEAIKAFRKYNGEDYDQDDYGDEI